MTESRTLRAALVGLIGFAGVEEQLLLATEGRGGGDPGTPSRWTARAVVAHNTEFKTQQVERLRAIADGATPPQFGDIDHTSEDVYARYCREPVAEVRYRSRQITSQLMDCLDLISDADLLEPSRNAWLNGRQLWLQVAVRGFWHPTGHVAGCYLSHDAPDRAVELAIQAVSTADYLRAPDQVRAMACYNLACAHGRAGTNGATLAALEVAVRMNPDLRANAERDPDLERLRQLGGIDNLLAVAPPRVETT